jgi:hypothetical protein
MTTGASFVEGSIMPPWTSLDWNVLLFSTFSSILESTVRECLISIRFQGETRVCARHGLHPMTLAFIDEWLTMMNNQHCIQNPNYLHSLGGRSEVNICLKASLFIDALDDDMRLVVMLEEQ